jgi:glycosyltransferase involved in cell wall biosynthesis
MKKVIFISPMYNATAHLEDLVESLTEQRNTSWEHIIVDDVSTDGSYDFAVDLTKNDDRFTIVKNKEKSWALKNVISHARCYQDEDDVVIAVIDADDALCNENTVDLLISAYEDDVDTVWTSHSWDINGLNISKGLPQSPPVNPYQYPWVSSHLKTWRASLLKEVTDENFKNMDGEWFRRGYDQALYLPLLYLSRKRVHLDEVCYLYRINSKSVKVREWSEKDQMDTVRLVRSRGLIR